MSEFAFEVGAGDLARVMKVAAQVVERRNTLPILGHVLIDASDEELRVTATDLDVEFTQSIPAKVKADLALAIPVERLAAIANAVDAKSFICFAADGNGRVVLRSGRSRWTLAVLPAEDFPRMPIKETAAAIAIDAARLAAVLARVMPFRSTNEVKFYLHGPLWHGENGQLALAALDGNILFQQIVDEIDWPEGAPEIILGPKGARIAELLCAAGGQAQFRWSEARIEFDLGDARLIAKNIDGTFPDYRRVIARKSDTPVTLNVETVRKSLARLRIASDKKTNAVDLDLEEGTLALSMRSGDGEASARAEIAIQNGAVGASAFNAQYLDTMLAAIGGADVVMHHDDGAAPARFEPAEPDGCVGTIMVMRR
ncbi:DNA polymerase III subunit beta [Erythrobacter rubeus]|uniref:Beta sliding clamp n=1 Tax=Erythrobacter rubeus TaxID=2760803 RepID=A0ABR8KPQ0_9SPHN|nr:DNA polymerase III subunit beta [Erythrobacter rubeus]MBD2842687.1 DNA polymerase III subunit beta [Erythrobacter rubeus]